MSLVVEVRVPESFSRLLCPNTKPLFKAKPDVVKDNIFQERLKVSMGQWMEVKELGVEILPWWVHMVKTGIKKLLIERGKEINKESCSLVSSTGWENSRVCNFK